ncbi:hypothetical protein B739_0126 [Riemerella anatipestifer RA-CH-1]|uniref:Uncharacterized protein n=2 Tax=Riemerella anatipestifer TaxID=34085 RepID=J9QZB5_RIEAN|nr:hypothetical protein B739_0126 [Riemerella anatipestifer RA-CH-1]AIH01732.1 hypothetical protein M949_0561 [Riemerella anatipestifer CH3]
MFIFFVFFFLLLFGTTILIAPFVKLYTAIKEENKRNILLYSITLLLFILSFLIISIIPK